MKQQFRRPLLTGSVGVIICMVAATLCASGCAKQEIVRQDQTVPPVINTPSPAAKPEVPVAVVKEQSIKEAQIQSQSPIVAKEQDAVGTSLENIYFDFDSFKLSPAARDTLVKTSEILRQKATIEIRIEGNCDELGSDDYNLALGEKRAKEAMKYLEAMGIPDVRLSFISYGKEKPAVSGHDEAARAKNRRDEFIISTK